MDQFDSGWERIALEAKERFPSPAWQTEAAPDGDVAVSTRARIARNLPDLPFPHRSDADQRRLAADRLLPLVETLLGPKSHYYSVNVLDQSERDYLIGQRLISRPFAQPQSHAWVAFDAQRRQCVLINEEDHLRAQAILAGSQVTEATEMVARFVSELENRIPLAKLPGFGYLTASPFNAGAGVRVSVMMHLIALCAEGSIAEVVTASRGLGAVVRGLYGEGTRAVGGYFQVSSVAWGGETVESAVQRLTGTVRHLVRSERRARLGLQADMLRSRVDRSLEAMDRAARLSFADGLTILSWIRLGAMEQVLTVEPQAIDRLAALVEIGSQSGEGSERRRARFLRSVFNVDGNVRV